MKPCKVGGVCLQLDGLKQVSLIFWVPNLFMTLEKVHIIRNCLQTTYSRQKSYYNHRRRDLEFDEGDKV